MAMAMVMMVVVVMLVTRSKARFGLQLVQTTSMHLSRVRTSRLETGMRQKLHNRFKIFHSSFRGPGQGDYQRLIANTGDRPGHHRN